MLFAGHWLLVPGYFSANQADIRFMDERGSFQRLAWFFGGQFCGGEPAELVIDERKELLGGLRVAAVDGGENARDFAHAAQHKRRARQSPARGVTRPRAARGSYSSFCSRRKTATTSSTGTTKS